MAIKIRMVGDSWILEVHEESWKFENRQDLMEELNHILDTKESKGKKVMQKYSDD